jgi:hypothetical protein
LASDSLQIGDFLTLFHSLKKNFHIGFGIVVRTLVAILTVVVSSIVIPAVSSEVHAASLTVTTLSDVTDGSDGVLSLREAVASASSGDSISFSAGLFSAGQQTLALNEQIAISGTITINGPGQNLLSIVGKRVDSNMTSYSRTSNVVTVQLSSPALFAVGNTVFLYNSSTIFNGAYVVSTVSGNTFTIASNGADISNTSATASVASSTVSPTVHWGFAGRAFDVAGSLTIKDLTIEKFMAERGGAIKVTSGGRVTAERVTFSNNVGSGRYCGGAINAVRGWVTAIDSNFVGNIAWCASGIQMGDGSGTYLNVSGSTFTNNISGASTIQSYLPMTFINSNMSGSRSLTNSSMTGIYMGSFGMPFTMTGSTVSDSVVVSNSSRVIITGSTLSSVSITDALATIRDNTITSCTVSSSVAVDISSGNTIGNASGCSVVSGLGAKIDSYSRSGGVLTITTSTPHGINVGDSGRICGVQALAPAASEWCALTFTVLSVTSTTLTLADNRSDAGTTLVYSTELDRAAYVFTNVPFLLPQSITWSPTTALSSNSSPITPSVLASTNGNGAITYAVLSAGATGCTVGASTGVLTFSSSGSCTIRATAAATSSFSLGSRDVIFVISSSTTASTVAPTQNTASSQPQGQVSVATIAPSSGPTTTVLTPMRPQVSQATSISIPTVVTTVANAPTVVAPKAPALAPGEAGAVVDGKTIAATLSRADNQITAAAGDITTTVSGLTPDGQRVSLNEEGILVLDERDKIVVEASGIEPNEDVEVWMFSTPAKLGVIAADANGKIAGTFNLPTGIESGDHRVVISGTNPEGTGVVIGIGISYGAVDSGSSITRLLITIPIALAVLFGLFLPAVTRRRKKNAIA